MKVLVLNFLPPRRMDSIRPGDTFAIECDEDHDGGVGHYLQAEFAGRMRVDVQTGAIWPETAADGKMMVRPTRTCVVDVAG